MSEKSTIQTDHTTEQSPANQVDERLKRPIAPMSQSAAVESENEFEPNAKKAKQTEAEKSENESDAEQHSNKEDSTQDTPSGPSGDKKKKSKPKKRNYKSYSLYVHRVLKEVHPDHRITKKTMAILDSMINDIYDRLCDEMAHLLKYAKRNIIAVRDVEAAVRLVFPGELSTHVVAEGNRAFETYKASLPPKEKKSKKADVEN